MAGTAILQVTFKLDEPPNGFLTADDACMVVQHVLNQALGTHEPVVRVAVNEFGKRLLTE